MRSIVVRFAGDETGATSIEYGLIAAIICLGIIAGFAGIRDGLTARFNSVNTAIPR